ncbi:MAG: hypothetical protein K8R21_08030 [Leptospira sp.]|nr:hypothetical protein [Leptospira sp.]
MQDNRLMKSLSSALILSLTFAGFFPVVAEGEFEKVNRTESISQGEIYMNQAKEYFADGLYGACIEKVKDFQLLFRDHPSMLKSYKLLSDAYRKIDRIDRAIDAEMRLYKSSPITEEGLSGYLSAARYMARTGKIKDARKVFEDIKAQVYSVKLAQEADLELRLIQITEEESGQ